MTLGRLHGYAEVAVDRRPVADPVMTAAPRIGCDEIRVPLTEGEAVVEKRVVSRGDLVVRKHQVQEDEVIEADLRRERIDVDRNGGMPRTGR